MWSSKLALPKLPLLVCAFAVVIVAAAVASSAPPVPVQVSSRTTAIVTPALGRDIRFNDDWKFFKGDPAKAAESAFDDASWRILDVPHDWSAESEFDPKLASCTAFLPCGVGWYRKSFVVPADAKSRVVSIRFDGVMNHSTAWLNGHEVGGRPYGYSSFTIDLTPAIKFGAENVLAVRVNHEQYADSRWYAGSGIYRNVFLSITNSVHVDTDGTFVTTPNVSAASADVSIDVSVKNDSAASANVTTVTTIVDAKRQTVATLSGSGSASRGATTIKAAGTIPRPSLWSPSHPTMYVARTLVMQNGKEIDRYETPFGVRAFAFDPATGFSINGERMKLKGVCLHHDAGALGAAVPIQVWERRLALLQAAGVNAIRASHNPPAPEFLDLADRMGFLVMDEAFDEWSGGKKKWIVGHNVGTPGTDGYHSDFAQWSDIDVHDMVVRDRNHPSIILWSVGNEIDYNNDPFPPNSSVLPPIAERLVKDVKALDVTRPVTAAMAFPATNLFKGALDVEGYNYMERLYDADHAARPNRVIYGSENSHALATWQSVAQNDFIAGQFLWTGIDYLGEGGVWPSHGSGAGLLNLAGFPKNQYYFRQSLWSDAPMVYLSTTGLGGRGRAGGSDPGVVTISAFTNCDSVELFHDGQSLGVKTHAPGDILTWPVTFTSGTLRAVGHKGAATTTFELKKAGPAAKLVLTHDVTGESRPGLHAKGDVAQIEVDVTDAAGVIVPDSAHTLTFVLTGPARILGIENGNLNGTESNTALTHSAFQGRMIVYVQATRPLGSVTLTVSSPNLTGARIVVPIK